MTCTFLRRLLPAVLIAIALFPTAAMRADEAPRRIEITARKFAFSPGEITLRRGEPVVLVVKSLDVSHGLRFRDFNVDVKVRAGGTGELRFTPDKTGDFVGHCSVFCGSGHGTMAVKLHVVD